MKKKIFTRYKIGVISEYIYDVNNGPWEPYIQNHPRSLKISINQGEPHMLKLLLRKRIDIAVLNWNVAKHSLKNNEQYSKIKITRKGISSDLHVGFTRSKRGQKMKNLFNLGFRRLIGTEKLAAIYKKYNIKMPQFTLQETKQ